MKSNQIIPVLMLSLLLGGCQNIESTDSQNVDNSNIDNTSASDSKNSSSDNKEEILLSNREREYNAQVLIGEMVNCLAKQPGDIKKVKKANQLNETQEGKFLTNISMHSLYGQGPEIKSLNEPLSQAFGMISYFSQYNKTDYSIFDTTFYGTYSRPIYDDETGKYINSEECYESRLTIRDFPNSDYKMIHIRYWSSYNYLILIDEEENFSILSEYVNRYRYKFDEEGKIIGLEEGYHSSFNIQGDDYFVGANLKTLDYNNDVESIKEEFKNIFEPNNMNMCLFLIEQYYNLYKQDNGTYDMERLTNKNEDINVEDERYVSVDSLVDGKDSYLFYTNLADSFMEQNYDRISNASSYDPERIFDIDGTTIKGLNRLNNLVIIPDTITAIDGLLEQDITVEGTIPEHPYGNGLFIPSSITSIKDGALKGNIMFEFSHVFVDISKDECPFVDVLENSGVQIYYKDEFECISGVYLPKIQE